MKYSNMKSAFTLAEVLIAMGIIGIIVTFGLKAALQNDKGIRHIYSNTYHVLDTTLYNAINFPKANSVGDPFADTDGGRTLVGRVGRGDTINADEGTERLCLRLTEYINTVETNPCQASPAFGTIPARRASRFRLISDAPNDRDFTPEMVQFTATNGVRFFFSRRMPYANIGGTRTLQAGEEKFYIIYADINGRKFPNSMNYRSESDINHRVRSIDPDIFAFAALESGRVVPLGPPEFDGRFMLTRVTYFNTENSQNEENTDILYSRPSQPYFLSKAQAWGYYNANKPSIRDTDIIPDNPYSYNGYIKSKIDARNSQIYSHIQNFYDAAGNVLKVPASANIKENPVNNGGFNCHQLSDEECDIVVDKYVY